MALSAAKERLRQQAVTRLGETIVAAQAAIRILGELATDPKEDERIGNFFFMNGKQTELVFSLSDARRALGKAGRHVEEMYKKKGTGK